MVQKTGGSSALRREIRPLRSNRSATQLPDFSDRPLTTCPNQKPAHCRDICCFPKKQAGSVTCSQGHQMQNIENKNPIPKRQHPKPRGMRSALLLSSLAYCREAHLIRKVPTRWAAFFGQEFNLPLDQQRLINHWIQKPRPSGYWEICRQPGGTGTCSCDGIFTPDSKLQIIFSSNLISRRPEPPHKANEGYF